MKHDTLRNISARVLSLSAAAALTLAPTALADTADSALVKGGRLNLRAEASLSAKVLGQFPTGTLVEILEPGQDWHKVQVDGVSGYMMAKYLSGDAREVSATVRTNTGAGLNFREEPHMEGAIITSYKPGTAVTVLQKGAAWSRVRVGDREGFMATRYLAFGQQSASPAGKIALVNNPKPTQVLNLREEASLDARVLDYYRNGVRVTILKAGDTWHKVQTEDGKIGYMMAKFLKLTDESASMTPYTAKVVNVNGGSYVNFRSGPSLNAKILHTIPVGTELTITAHDTDWCQTSFNGVNGYISTWFLAK